MVRLKNVSDEERLEEVINKLCQEYKLKVYVNGWARKTYDIFEENRKLKRSEHLVRIESLSITTGEIRYFEDKAEGFAKRLGEELETAFDLEEAILIRENKPGY